MPMSNKHAKRALMGSISRGKYILVNIWAADITLADESLSPLAKNNQGRRPDQTKTAGGAPLVGNRPTRIINVNTSIVSSGRRIDQAAPRVVCLYRANKSRQVSIYSSSLCCQISAQYVVFTPPISMSTDGSDTLSKLHQTPSNLKK